MKKFFILCLVLLASGMNAQDMQEYLSETRQLIAAGNYRDALEHCIWFHEHALEKEPAMRGVRLSFALQDWKKLADAYPPAMEALIGIRDTKTSQIEADGGTPDLFADVAAINRTVGNGEKTVALFASLDATFPDMAKKCWRYAKSDLFSVRRYDLIGKYIGAPMAYYSTLVDQLDLMLTSAKKMADHEGLIQSYAKGDFAEKCIQAIDFCMAVNDVKSAKDIQQAAMKVVPDSRLASAVTGRK